MFSLPPDSIWNLTAEMSLSLGAVLPYAPPPPLSTRVKLFCALLCDHPPTVFKVYLRTTLIHDFLLFCNYENFMKPFAC